MRTPPGNLTPPMDPDFSALPADPDRARPLQRRWAAEILDRWIAAGPAAVAVPAREREQLRFRRPGHYHPVPEAFVQVRGGSSFRLPGGAMALHPGAILILPAGLAHQEEASPGSLNLVVKMQGGCCHFHLGWRGRDVIPDAIRTDLGPCANRLLDEAAAGAHRGHLLRAWACLVRGVLAGPGVSEAHADPVRRALVCIRERLGDPGFRAAAAARAVGMSPDHLSRLLRAATGAGLHATLAWHRMAAAEQLLADPALRVGDVARACGFADPDYFTRCFRRRFGIGPRAWRARAARSAGG